MSYDAHSALIARPVQTAQVGGFLAGLVLIPATIIGLTALFPF